VHPDLKVQKFLGVAAPTRYSYLVNNWCPETEYRVHNSNINNLERAVLEREFFVKYANGFAAPHVPAPDAYRTKHHLLFRQKIAKCVASTTCAQQLPISNDKFVECYTGRKRTLYKNAVVSLSQRGVCQSDARVDSFVKAEKINFEGGKDPAPRLIKPRDPRYNVEVGRYLKPIEHHVYKAIATIFKSQVVMKGKNAAERGHLLHQKWLKFRRPVAVEVDAARFDQHVHELALKYEHSCYIACVPSSERGTLGKLLGWQRRYRVYGRTKDGKLKYDMKGHRCSGDMNTALGNCLLSCANAHEWLELCNVKAEVADDGDDLVFIMEEEDLSRFTRGFTEYYRTKGLR